MGKRLFQLRDFALKRAPRWYHFGNSSEINSKSIIEKWQKKNHKKPFYHSGRYTDFFKISIDNIPLFHSSGIFFHYSRCIFSLLRIIFQIDFLMKKHSKNLYLSITVTPWRCDAVALWRCGAVMPWRCDAVAPWCCDAVALWCCGAVAL